MKARYQARTLADPMRSGLRDGEARVEDHIARAVFSARGRARFACRPRGGRPRCWVSLPTSGRNCSATRRGRSSRGIRSSPTARTWPWSPRRCSRGAARRSWRDVRESPARRPRRRSRIMGCMASRSMWAPSRWRARWCGARCRCLRCVGFARGNSLLGATPTLAAQEVGKRRARAVRAAESHPRTCPSSPAGLPTAPAVDLAAPAACTGGAGRLVGGAGRRSDPTRILVAPRASRRIRGGRA